MWEDPIEVEKKESLDSQGFISLGELVLVETKHLIIGHQVTM